MTINRNEQLALVAGLFMGSFVGLVIRKRMQALSEDNYALKADNINLLSHTVTILNSIDDISVVPQDILVDIEFRRMAFISELDEMTEEN